MLAEIALTLLISILAATSFLHAYWACGGQWALKNAVPILEGDKQMAIPGPIPTLMVSVALLVAAVIFLWHTGVITITLPNWIHVAGVWTVSVIFLARSIGEFHYLGFFKKIRDTDFGRLDTLIYSPLCLIVAILGLIVILGSPT